MTRNELERHRQVILKDRGYCQETGKLREAWVQAAGEWLERTI